MTGKSYRATLQLLDIPVGGTVSTECPKCGHKNFSVSNRDGSGYLYNCFRASCGYKGYVPLGGLRLIPTDAPIASREQPRPYSGPLYAPNAEDRALLEALYGFTDADVAVSRAKFTESGDIAYPILANDRTVKGTHFRRRHTVPGAQKAHTQLNSSNVTKSSWYCRERRSDGDVVILVEDIPSAVRASAYVDAVALLGTSLDPRDIPLIAGKYREVWIALDPDANEAALRIRNWLDGWVDWVSVKMLPRDIKDMRESELQVMVDVWSGWAL